MMQTGYESKGTGLSYSINGGDSWTYLSQPIDSIPEIDMDGFKIISWGGQDIYSLSVTTDINNVSYDIAMDDIYIYTANWAGGVRRFNHLPNPGQIKEWEIIPLPRDGDRALYCGEIDSTYSINPKDPGDGGNHNHKGFSVFGSDEYLWVGTANGINRGTITDNCIDWYHQTIENGLSGNWVIGIEEQTTDNINRIWAITWDRSYSGSHHIYGGPPSYSDDGGNTWHVVNEIANTNALTYNIAVIPESSINHNNILVSTNQLIFLILKRLSPYRLKIA